MDDFVQQIGCFPFGPHIVAETVIAEAYRNAQAHHTFYIGRADGIVHIAARLVGDPGASFAQQRLFSGVDVDGVGDDTLGTQDARLGQTINDALVIIVKGIIFVGLMLGGVDVETGIEILGGSNAVGQRLVAQGK